MDKKVVLVVDDAPMNITMLAGILKDHYKVKVAKDGERALKIAGMEPVPDLVLLDVMMPGMDGYEVCRRLKSGENTRGIPVVFVTGMNDTADQEKSMEMGAAGHLTKPVDAETVTRVVRELIG